MKLSTNELETAANLCRQIQDCGGITKNGQKYEIRAGPATEGTDEESWIRQTDPSGLENATKNGSKYIMTDFIFPDPCINIIMIS